MDPEGLCAARQLWNNLWYDWFFDISDFVAGFGDALSFHISAVIRDRLAQRFDLGNTVNERSFAYKAGEIATLALGLARLGYAAGAKALPFLIRGGSSPLGRALRISAARNTLKRAFRLNPFSKSRIYSSQQVVSKYGANPQAIIDAATTTNMPLNILGGTAATGATTNIVITRNE
jgi:hypothetical protein